MSSFRQRFLRPGLMLSGVILVTVALLLPNRNLEEFLLGSTARSLSWGPTLFRILLGLHGGALLLCALLWKRPAKQSNSSIQAVGKSNNLDATRWSSWAVLVVLSVVALGLRLWHLNSDLWYDELISLLDYFRPSFGEIVTSFSSQNQHMLYSILAHASLKLFGETAWAIRLPAVGFGIASLWALFLLGKKLMGEREALFACALMTVSYHHIWFSQNARGYMGMLFFTLLASWVFLEAVVHDTWKLWIGYAVAVSLGMWSHMTMAFVVAAHGLIYVGMVLVPYFFKNQPTSNVSLKPVVSAVLCVSFSLQLHAVALPDFMGSALHQESLQSEWSNPLWFIIEGLRSFRLGVLGIAMAIPALVLVSVGWFSILKRNAMAAVAMVLPAFLGGTTMLVLGHYIWPRFFFFSIGFGILIAVHGAITLPTWLLGFSRLRSLVIPKNWLKSIGLVSERSGLVLASLLIVASIVTLPRLYAYPKQNFSGARDWVERSRAPEDGVVAVGLAGVAYGRYFAPDWSVAQSKDELDAIGRAHTNVWLVYTIPIQLKAYRPEVWNVIQNDFQTVEIFPGTLGGGGVYVCRKRTLDDKAQARNTAKPETSLP